MVAACLGLVGSSRRLISGSRITSRLGCRRGCSRRSWWMGWCSRRGAWSSGIGFCRRGGACTTCWRWRCLRIPRMRGGCARGGRGREPLRLLFEAVARPLATETTRGAFYRQWRLMSLDGTCLDVADTAANEQEFGRPGSSRREGGGAFPQLRLVALSETGTHAICAAAMGPLSSSENALADELLGRLSVGMLCLADRGFYSFGRWQNARQTGAQLLWRVKANMVLPREQQLSDGSYLTRIYADQPDQRAHRGGEQVRVGEYQLGDGLRHADARELLLTTIRGPEQAPAAELGMLYHERWEIENALDELKVHQRGPRVVLRSKAPDGGYQEAYGYLCTHYAIRRLMHDAALNSNLDPDRLSFTRSLRAARPASAAVQPARHQAQDVQLAGQAARAPQPAQADHATRRRHHRLAGVQRP